MEECNKRRDEDCYHTRFSYPTDYSDTLQGMIDANMIGVPSRLQNIKTAISYLVLKQNLFKLITHISLEFITTPYEFRRLLHANHHELQSSIWERMPIDEKRWSPDNVSVVLQQEYPVMEIKNASYSQVRDVLAHRQLKPLRITTAEVPSHRISKHMEYLRSKLPAAQFRSIRINRWSDVPV